MVNVGLSESRGPATTIQSSVIFVGASFFSYLLYAQDKAIVGFTGCGVQEGVGCEDCAYESKINTSLVMPIIASI